MIKLVINRNGIFYCGGTANNKCKDVTHSKYKYTVAITCDNELDEDGFIIDQLLIHEYILEHIKNKALSCEQYCQEINGLLVLILHNKKIEWKEIYIKVAPILQNRKINRAYMELINTRGFRTK